MKAQGQPKGTKGQQQGKGGKQQKGSKKQDKQKQKPPEQLPQQQKAGLQPIGGKGDKQVPSKDEKPSGAGGDSSEQPQKTKAELKAERRAIQVNLLIYFEIFMIILCGPRKSYVMHWTSTKDQGHPMTIFSQMLLNAVLGYLEYF